MENVINIEIFNYGIFGFNVISIDWLSCAYEIVPNTLDETDVRPVI